MATLQTEQIRLESASVSMAELPAMMIVAEPKSLNVAQEALVEFELGWEVVFARSLAEATEIPYLRNIDVILIDLANSHLDGVEITEALCQRFPELPVVLMSPPACVSIALEAMRKGAVNHFPKDLLDTEPAAILESLREVARHRRARFIANSTLSCQQLEFTLENNRNLVPAVVEDIRERLLRAGVCDRVTTRRIGVALEECLLNAMVHGNLEVSSELRQQDEIHYDRAIEERRNCEPYRDRRVKLQVSIRPSEATFRIEDEGPGFDISKLPDPTDATNLFRVGGRGLLLMRSFMTSVTFSGRGNVVTLVKKSS